MCKFVAGATDSTLTHTSLLMAAISAWHSVRRGGRLGKWGEEEGMGGRDGPKASNTRWILTYRLADPERSRHLRIVRGQWDLLTGMLIYWGCPRWLHCSLSGSVCVNNSAGGMEWEMWQGGSSSCGFIRSVEAPRVMGFMPKALESVYFQRTTQKGDFLEPHGVTCSPGNGI